jgi:hypothetical protein
MEEDLCSAFGSIDIQALTFLDNRPSLMHRSFQTSLDAGIERMPKNLTTLQECERYWKLILRMNLHVIAAIRQELSGEEQQGNMATLLNRSYVAAFPGNNLYCH